MKFLFSIIALGIIFACSTNQNKTMEKNHLYEDSKELDEQITINSNAITSLQALLAEAKFEAIDSSDQYPYGYVGLLPEDSRPEANELLNTSIERLIEILSKEKMITKRMILDEFEIGLESFEEIAVDTEDRERLCYYYEEMMDILGLESTNELLNNWMY